MKKITLFVTFAIAVFTGFSQQNNSNADSPNAISRPKLVVGIVVDQMRWDYLYKYYDRYGNGGFKRLLGEGFSCDNTMINYVPSVTGVGHSSIFTGSVPAIHGIAENYWIDQLSGKGVYCTDDSTVQSVGTNNNVGKMSPRNLLVSTVTDELRLATNFQSKVVGVSLKDRASILPAGHAANAAFWFDDSTGNFITSTYYMQALPEWVVQFNKSKPVVSLIKSGWNTLYPIDTYQNSESDNQVYEGRFSGETKSTFPHNINEIYKRERGSLRTSPFGNTLTLNFAKQAIEGYQLGNGKATDFLTINCASTDYVGHMFGPNSIEIEDTYLRLDKDLETFFLFLDNKVGKGQYTIFLTADHGAAHTAGYTQKNKLPFGLANMKVVTDSLNSLLEGKFGAKGLILSEIGDQVDFDRQRINSQHLDFDAIKKVTTDYLQQQRGIMYAVDESKIGEAPIPEPLKTMIINGYNIKRTSPVRVIFNPGWSQGETVGTGTGHGSIHPYDVHLPLLFMGWGIRHGSSKATVNVTDIAPTISALLHIQMPSGNIGHVIEEVLK
jgi:predicted AlkP superfamily pyrophosphatase or phosphodiesterase